MLFPDNIFKNRQLVIATKHHKESVIAPLFENNFNSKCVIPDNFDTDILGTFSGEIERKFSPINTLRKKCMMALEQTGLDLAVASEGSFGNHPLIFFSKANEELVMLLDKVNNIEIVGKELTTMTNYNSEKISSWTELEAFCDGVKFPSHGIILKAGRNNVFKGINSKEQLKVVFEKNIKENKSVVVATDMRALYNPTRMGIIEKATKNLISNIKSVCLKCNAPGFIVHKKIAGLPCEFCNSPTKSPLYYEYKCKHCNYIKQEKYPLNKQTETPQYCDNCNP